MYEGGPGIVESGAIAHGSHVEAVTQKAIEFNRHGLMESAVTDVLEAWRSITKNDYNSEPGIYCDPSFSWLNSICYWKLLYYAF